MSRFEVGIRNRVEDDEMHHWQYITAKAADQEGNQGFQRAEAKTPFVYYVIQMNTSNYWRILIICTIFINIFSSITYFWLASNSIVIIIITHMTCFFYWIDLIVAIIEKKHATYDVKTRSTIALAFDAISLIPLSVIYLIAVPKINQEVLWKLRTITLIRFYRIPLFFSTLSGCHRNHWYILLCSYVCYLIIFLVSMSNIFLYKIHEYTPINIESWNETAGNKIIVSLYFTIQIAFNVAYGDIMPDSYSQVLLCALAMAVGSGASNGVFTGILSTTFTNGTKQREHYRYEFEATKNTLLERKIEPTVTKKILDNMNTLWNYKKGFKGSPPVHILPLSMQREIYFDINFGLLNRSLIFSLQPRSFLRSVTMFMKNLTYLPGDIILEPGMSDAMICVASGVIEVLSESNDESVLFSLTKGTIIGEASLFIPLATRCIIRASTYVELQVLMKVHFTRLALTYPEVFRSMRDDIFYRLQFKEADNIEVDDEKPEQFDPKRRRETKKFLKKLKDFNRDNLMKDKFTTHKTAILRLYVLSENIPRVKTLPITLIRAKPWILRPDTSLTKFWGTLIVLVIVFVAIAYPVWTGFHRVVEPGIYVALVMTKAVYIVDVYMECTTAIEEKDHYTYIASTRDIIAYKLKSFGFYFDVLSTYYLSIYASLIWPDQADYASLLLSLNALLKTWRVYVYMKRLENDMNNNLLFIVTVKYMLWIAFIVTWGAVLMYVEARPGESYIEHRWFSKMEKQDVYARDPNPRSFAPQVVTFYFATVTTFALGYGDIVAASVPDCVIAIICILSGFTLLIYWVSEACSVMKHLARIKTSYQEELFAVGRFMHEHEIPKDCQNRVNNYLRLQWDYDKGYSLKQISISEVLPALQRRIFTMELTKTFLSVPLFRKVGHGFLKLLAKLCKVRVLPPNELIMERGSFIREMYILENGYCQIQSEADQKSQIIGAVNPFGFLEMIKGKQQRLTVKTLTHARIISLNYSSYLKAVTKFPGVKVEIEDIIEKFYNRNSEEMTLGFDPFEESAESREALNIQKEIITKPFINVYKYHKTIDIEYTEPFRAWGKFRIFQFMLLPFAILPNTLFIKIWMSIRICTALIIGLIAPIQFSLLNETHEFMKFIMILQVFAAVDMYLMFHMAYYDKRGLLMFHPAKTATQYLKGNFILDLISVFPYYWIINLANSHDDNANNFFKKASGLIMILQLYKFFQGCFYLEKDILRKTDIIKILKLFPFVLIVINFVTALVILLQCYKVKVSKIAGLQGGTRLAKELTQSLTMFCELKNTMNESLENPMIYKMYLTTVYWVTTTLTVCGFGDIVAHNESSMVASIIMIMLGIFFFTYMFASITSNLVNTNVLISKHRRRMLSMLKFIKKKNVNPELQKRFTLHYEYNWLRTEGAAPQVVFSFVHASLRENIVTSMYQATLQKNPAFQGLEKQIVAIICKQLDELYFVRGETIIKHKDIQEHLYLIYRGEVHVISPSGRLITAMGSGGMFGNISNKSFSLSNETVVAAENSDLIRLDRKTFFSDLQVILFSNPTFPDTAQFIQNITSRDVSYLPPERSTEFVDYFTIPIKMNKFRIPQSAIDRAGSTISLRNAHMGAHVLKDTLFYIHDKPYSSFVILPDTPLQKGIDMCLFAMAYCSSTLTMYMFAFQDVSICIMVVTYLFDLVFLIEIFLQFHMTYFDMFGDCIVKTEIIRKRYIRSNQFIYDILSNLPLEIFMFAWPHIWWEKMFTIFRLNRILRLNYIFRFYKMEEKKLMSNKIYLQMSWLIVIVSLMTHTLACVWFVVVCPLGYCQSPTWVSDMDLIDQKQWEHYVYSMFQIIIVTATAGLQILPIYSVPEIVLTTIFMILCRYVVVLLSGLVVAAINADRLNLFVYQERIAELKETFTRQNISDYQLGKMWNYVSTLWLHEAGKQMPTFISTAPYTMKCEIMTEMFGRHLSQSYIFSRTQYAFLRQLACHLKRFVYFPGNYIVQQGEIDTTMYFIDDGEVSVLTIHPELMETIHFTLTARDSFGVKQGLIIGKAHNFTYRAETNVEVLLLTLSDWQHLLKYFPEDAEIINQKLDSLPEDIV